MLRTLGLPSDAGDQQALRTRAVNSKETQNALNAQNAAETATA